jgi:CxxC motif-containing protein (DUF1111 family)
MGPGQAGNMAELDATGSEWRSLEEAILWHGGEAAKEASARCPQPIERHCQVSQIALTT